MSLKSASYMNMHLRYLNQIHGPSMSSWRTVPSVVSISGRHFYQCRRGPDQWTFKLPSHKLSLKDVKLTKPNLSNWQNHPYFHCHDFLDNKGNLSKDTGTSKVKSKWLISWLKTLLNLVFLKLTKTYTMSKWISVCKSLRWIKQSGFWRDLQRLRQLQPPHSRLAQIPTCYCQATTSLRLKLKTMKSCQIL